MSSPKVKRPKIVAVIPARIGSKRLPKKNIQVIGGLPLVAWAIKTAQATKLIDDVYVSTESDEVATIARQYGAKVLDRPEELAGDTIRMQDVARQVMTELADIDVLVLVGANTPGLPPETLDAAIQKLLDHSRWEIRSVDKDGLEHFMFWIMTRQACFWDGLSVYFGVQETGVEEIHTPEDLERVRAILEQKIIA
ncbi:NTP transferase domain-containing protein [Candidatus Berkelbacteria bacterium]|nr:NTP transferase domain-containing protein [Candidatus Berkelbacteria bacterium]